MTTWVLSILLAAALIALAVLAVAHRRQLRLLRTLRRSDQQLTTQLRQRLVSESARRNELEALLGSMAEGVVAVDSSGGLLNLNRAAAAMLRLDRNRTLGQPMQENIRNSRVQEMLSTTLTEGAALQDEFELAIPGESLDRPHVIQAQTAPLHDGDGERIGALAVLHDVTQVRRLESVRRDFVANVSHEVKTPVAAIKAAVETLLDDHAGTMSRDDAVRFLRIVVRQADRLDAIVEDLLALARIEQSELADAEGMEAEAVAPVLRSAVETCQAKADEKQIAVRIECDPALRAHMRTNLIEQAVVNLVDNAVKYSPEQTTVRVHAFTEGDDAVIAVTDQGRGIEPVHLERIFERFYRTDRARSRMLGGTGLGLSIVKHVMEAHRGRVSVDSKPGTGSTFRLHLGAASDGHAAAGSAAIPPAA